MLRFTIGVGRAFNINTMSILSRKVDLSDPIKNLFRKVSTHLSRMSSALSTISSYSSCSSPSSLPWLSIICLMMASDIPPCLSIKLSSSFYFLRFYSWLVSVLSFFAPSPTGIRLVIFLRHSSCIVVIFITKICLARSFSFSSKSPNIFSSSS